MDSKLEKIVKLVQKNPIEFRRFSRDTQQIAPETRVVSISHILGGINLPKNSTVIDIGTG